MTRLQIINRTLTKIITFAKAISIFILGWTFLLISRIASRIILRTRVIGEQNIPKNGAVIVIANHFSWFDAPLLTLHLPCKPAFLVASESQRFWYVRWFMRAFQGIPIWRGRVDRHAIQQVLGRLQQGKAVGIFPEGGIEPKNTGKRTRGEQILDSRYTIVSRTDAQLTHPEPGTAYLAVESQAKILPVGLIGTEKIVDNLLRFRRTEITVRIGSAFGPLEIDPHIQGADRRNQLNRLGEEIMHRIAILFPPENRGPYRGAKLEGLS